MMHLLDDFSLRAKKYFATLHENPVYPAPDAVEQLKEFDIPLQNDPMEAREVLQELDGWGSPATVKSAGGRYFGFVVGGSLPAALSAKLLATVWDQNAYLSIMSPVASKLEEVSSGWLKDLLGLPEECATGFVTGDTMANFSALAAARHALLKQLGWDVEAKGLFHAPEITVIVGDEVHVSVLKVLSMLGFGRDRIITVPADSQGRIIAEKIPSVEGPCIVCTQAGNVNSGSFDPIGEICRKFRNSHTWIHVDAAFGLWAAASPEKKYLVEGIGLADSWATDAHKWLNVPYDCGLVFVRNRESLFSAMSATASYLPGSHLREPGHYVPDMSREARGIVIWAALRSLGRKGIAGLVERNCRQAARLAKELEAAGFSILNEVVLNQVLVSFGDDATTQKVMRKIQEEGTCWCGGTKWQGKSAMRISVSSWATTEEDIDKSLKAIVRVASLETATPA